MIRLSHAILRLYPRAWRERYADEMRALLTDRGVGLDDLIDLARGVIAERRLLAAVIAGGRIVAGTYASYVLAMVGTSLIVFGINTAFLGRGSAAWGEIAAALAERPWLLAAILSALTAICTLVMLTASPALIGLAVARRWKSRRLEWVAGLAAACCGAWWQYRMEWFDVWRHQPSFTAARWLWWTYVPMVASACAAGWMFVRLVPQQRSGPARASEIRVRAG